MSELLGRLLGDPFVTTLLLGMGAAIVGLWLAACWWAYRDAARRTGSAFGPYLAAAWVFLSGPVLLPLSLGIYSLFRPLEPIADRRSRALLASLDPTELEQAACPGCGAVADDDWRRCPTCGTWLGLRCDRCARWAPADSTICPWCAWQPGEAADPETLVVRPLVPVMVPAGEGAAAIAGIPAAEAAVTAAAVATAAAPPTPVPVSASPAGHAPAPSEAPPITAAWNRIRLGRAAWPAFTGAAVGSPRAAQVRTPGSRPSREREAVERPGGPRGG